MVTKGQTLNQKREVKKFYWASTSLIEDYNRAHIKPEERGQKWFYGSSTSLVEGYNRAGIKPEEGGKNNFIYRN